MASLPLFKLASLFVRHISKYGGNWIKSQAQEHPRFRVYAERYGQKMHQVNMRMAVTLLKDSTAEKRVKDKSEPLVKNTEQNNAGDIKNLKDTAREKSVPKVVPSSVWKRKFRPLPEGKAVELFANVVGDTFVLLVAGTLISYEYVRTKGKPDVNAEKIAELYNKLEELDRRERVLESVNNDVKLKVEALETTLSEVRKNKTNNMFCTSLRGRCEWNKVPALLLATKFPKWKEHELDTFDLALPITSRTTGIGSPDFFQIILLSSVDLKESNLVSARIQRLFYRQGGKNIGIIFLLNGQGQKDNSPKALMSIQESFLSDLEIPIIPLFSVESLEATMKVLQEQLGQPLRPPQRGISAVTLLPFCSIHPPMPNHARNLLSDLCS
ncbi:hypothetical protein EPUL_001600, partial [Erysiphe pulchra]